MPPLRRCRPSWAVRLYLRRIWGSARPPTDSHVQGYLNAMAAERFFPAMLEAARALLAFRLPKEALVRSGVPVCLLWGAEDRLVPLEEGKRLAEALAAPLTVLPGTGHCLPEEQPEALARALRPWSVRT